LVNEEVLRWTDPRYVFQMEFCKKTLPDYPGDSPAE